MRQIRSGVDAKLLLPAAGGFGIQTWLTARNSGLARVTFIPPDWLIRLVQGSPMLHATESGRTHTLSMWIGRVAWLYGISRRWLLMLLQAEQSLVSETKTLPNDFYWQWSTDHASDAPCGKVLRVRNRYIEVVGNWRMIAACGYGFPDGQTVYSELYLGIAAQVAFAAKWARDRRLEYERGSRVVRVEGEDCECADLPAYVTCRYTPFNREIEYRLGKGGVFDSMFGGVAA